jgi:O-antigen ligase
MPLKKIIKILFVLGLFFFPFNEYDGIPILGEFSSEAAALFFLPAFLLIIIYSFYAKKMYFPLRNKLYFPIILFIIWTVFSLLLNIHNILGFNFKSTWGITRFIRQFISLFLSVFVFVQVYWFVLKNMSSFQIFSFIRKIFTYSLVVVTIYGFVETMVVFFKFGFLKPLLYFFSYLPFLEVTLHEESRISSVAYEPPFLAIYLITISGWMFSYILTNKSLVKYIPTMIVLLLTFFSGSRTALIVITIQFLVFVFLLQKYYGIGKQIFTFFKYFVIVIFLVGIVSGVKFYDSIEKRIESLDFLGNLKNSPSNKSRLGIQYTSLLIFSENPIAGVGFGQQAYEARGRYPLWSTMNNYEFDIFYNNKKEKSFPPGYNIYTRILAELGIIGFSIFLYFQISLIGKAKKLIKHNNIGTKTIGLVLLVTLIGLFINWMQIDSFRIYGVWLCLAILIRVYQEINERNSTFNSTL